MVVQVNNKDRTIVKADVDIGAMTPVWFANNVVEGKLTDGSTFRCWTEKFIWAAFMA